MELTGRVIYPGTGAGAVLVLDAPLSLWGGVDPASGVVIDPRHPQAGVALGGRIVVMERAVGSSSSSAIMLELLRNGVAPAGLVLGDTDAILILGILVAKELGYPTIPVVEIDLSDGTPEWATGAPASLTEGVLEVGPQS
ncbi:MAG: aconitase X swivel domain-containing protein [Longimicrobiales bacterium]